MFVSQIYLKDINDNSPQFTEFPREFNVTEDTPPGTSLVNATANDLDRDDKLSYWLSGSFGLLDIDSRSYLSF